MTSFIAAGGSGRSTSVILAVPAVSSVATIAFMGIVSSPISLFGGSRANADDRLPADPLGRVEGCNGIVEGRDGADVRPQPSVPHPLDDLTQLGTIGQDDEVDRQAVRGPRLGWRGDRHQCSSSPDQAYGPLLDVSADDVENQVDCAEVCQRVVVEVDE